MKKTIKGTAKFAIVKDGNLSLKYDKDIVNWFKQFGNNEDGDYEVIYMNYDKVVRELEKLTGIIFDEYVDYPYWDKHYTNFMDFHVNDEYNDDKGNIEEIDAKIKKALRGKVFTIKLKAEDYA